jgi:polyisoprenoid-binding protein YceI
MRLISWLGALVLQAAAPVTPVVSYPFAVGEKLSYSAKLGMLTLGSGTLEVASIDTGEAQRDTHLRSADFFDADRFPEITFESTRVEPIDDNSSRVWGNLTMHGITHEVKLDLLLQGTDTDPWGNERAGAEVQGFLNRKDFDMKFNQALGSGNLLVGDKVRISLDISAILKK